MNCHCGRPLHYSSAEVEAFVLQQCKEFGEHILVTVGTRTFKVQRHYIALHGISGATVADLGFEEIRV